MITTLRRRLRDGHPTTPSSPLPNHPRDAAGYALGGAAVAAEAKDETSELGAMSSDYRVHRAALGEVEGEVGCGAIADNMTSIHH